MVNGHDAQRASALLVVVLSDYVVPMFGIAVIQFKGKILDTCQINIYVAKNPVLGSLLARLINSTILGCFLIIYDPLKVLLQIDPKINAFIASNKF